MSGPRLGIQGTRQRPDLRHRIAVCMSCEHWQADVRPGAISDLGGWLEAMQALALAHAVHLRDECPNAGGRIKYEGQWVEPPLMESGKAAEGTLALELAPRWWEVR